jgi:hypothetical protein
VNRKPELDGKAQSDGKALTKRALNRATLARQLLLAREPRSVADGVRRVVALQAQEPPSPYLALWNRLAPFDPAELDRAFSDHDVVKATLMRITLHAVHAADYPAFHEAMQVTLRGSRLNDRRFRGTGLTPADADALVPALLEFTAEPRMNADVQAWLTDRIGPLPEPGVWWALRQTGPFVHAPTGGPWSFGLRPSYLAAREQRRSGNPAASLRTLVRRYLEGFGPASVQDIAQFGLIYRPPIRAAVEALGDELERLEGPNGQPLLDVAGGPRPPEDTPAPPRLLGMWDSVLLAHADRTRIVPAEYKRYVTRTNGDVLPTLLVDGYVAGVWRPIDGTIEATAFRRLSDEAWDGLEREACALLALLAGRDPRIYTRYGRWWSDLPVAEVRRFSP